MPFKKPEVAPLTAEEYSAFDELDDVLQDHELSRAVGWAIQLKAKQAGGVACQGLTGWNISRAFSTQLVIVTLMC